MRGSRRTSDRLVRARPPIHAGRGGADFPWIPSVSSSFVCSSFSVAACTCFSNGFSHGQTTTSHSPSYMAVGGG